MLYFRVKIKGITPYLQHRMDDVKLEDWEKSRGSIIERDGINQSDLVNAEYRCYRNGNGKCYIPSEHIRGALINAGTFLKAKVGVRTKSMTSIVAAMFFVSPDHIEIPNWQEIDKRSAVNRNIKGRVIVIRPKWNDWSAEFTLSIGEDSITKETVRDLLEKAGNYVGVGSFRPTNKGSFGRFSLEKLKLII